MRLTINPKAEELLQVLQKAGFKAYVVGGCVRDAILGMEPHDWDITTNASPNEMLSVFKKYKVIPTGIKHGTITVMVNGEGFEITTFRVDGEYSDGRHPDNVTFVGNVVDDLSRRDFTINAMAYNNEEGLIDPFHGEEDIANGIIRCVGDADKRFAEDALRIMRCIRFAAKYNFSIDSKTLIAANHAKKSLSKVSVERLSSEFVKTLLARKPGKILEDNIDIIAEFIPEILPCKGFVQHNPYHEYDVLGHIMHTVDAIPAEENLRLAAFFHDICKPECFLTDKKGIGHFYGHAEKSADKTEEILRRLRFSNDVIKNVTELVHNHGVTIAEDEVLDRPRQARRMLNKFGYAQAVSLMKLHMADCAGHGIHTENHSKSLHSSAKAEDMIKLLGDAFEAQNKQKFVLAIDGNDIMKNLNMQPGPTVGKILATLKERAIDGAIENSPSALLALAKELA